MLKIDRFCTIYILLIWYNIIEVLSSCNRSCFERVISEKLVQFFGSHLRRLLRHLGLLVVLYRTRLREESLPPARGHKSLKVGSALGFDREHVYCLLQSGVQVLYNVGTLVFRQAAKQGVVMGTRAVCCDGVWRFRGVGVESLLRDL